MQYMTHVKHGAHHAMDEGEIERMEKAGWKKGTMPTADEINAAKKGAKADALRAELAALEAPVVATKPEKKAAKKPGPKKKVQATAAAA